MASKVIYPLISALAIGAVGAGAWWYQNQPAKAAAEGQSASAPSSQPGATGAATGGAAGGGSTTPNGGQGGSGVVILKYLTADGTITIGAGLTGSTATSGAYKITTITAGTGNVSWT